MNPETPSDDAPQPRRRQASAAVVRQRVEELVRVLLDGAVESWDVCEFVREQEKEAGSVWEVKEGEKPLSYSQIRRYVVKADKLIADSCRASRKKLLRRHLAQRRNLYAKAVSQGDMRTALAVIDSEAKLLNLFPPTRQVVTGKDGKPLFPRPKVLTREQFNQLTDDERLLYLRGQLAIEVTDDGESEAAGA